MEILAEQRRGGIGRGNERKRNNILHPDQPEPVSVWFVLQKLRFREIHSSVDEGQVSVVEALGPEHWIFQARSQLEIPTRRHSCFKTMEWCRCSPQFGQFLIENRCPLGGEQLVGSPLSLFDAHRGVGACGKHYRCNCEQARAKRVQAFHWGAPVAECLPVHCDFRYCGRQRSCDDLLILLRRMMDASYRLNLLGGLGLEGPKNLSGRVTQRRQLALLALLAAHETPLSRDKVIGFLWPETTAERARHQLSDALYLVRKELDEDAIVVTGDTVRLNPAIVGSDLADFRSALASESYEEALEAYRGPFLDGFFPEGSEPFERWIADQRASLKREAAQAAWTLVERAEAAGEMHEAVRWARRALEIVPEDERGVRRLIRLQNARGDRAGAVRTYEEFVARLETDLDMPPSEEMQALIAAIREPPVADRESEAADVAHERADTPRGPIDTVEGSDASPAAPRPERSPRRTVWIGAALAIVLLTGWLFFSRSEGGSSATTADGPAVVAVLPFEVRGEGLEVWREGMIDVLSTNLDVFSQLRAVPSRTVLAGWREAEPGALTDQTAMLEVAREINARYAVTGSVVGTENGMLIRAELIEVDTGDKLKGARAEGARDSIFTLVDRLAVVLMEPLLVTSGDSRWPRLASATTSSPEALEAFLKGEALYRVGRHQPAIDAFKLAIEADSTFALAYYRLSEAYTWTTSAVDSPDPAHLAARYADRLPEREARLVRAWSLATRGHFQEWYETLREAVRQHPDDPQAWYWLGEAYYHLGNEMLVPPWEFVDALERSIELDSSFAPAYKHLIDAAFQNGPDSARVATLIERRAVLGEGRFLEPSRVAFRLAFGGPHTEEEAHSLIQDIPLDNLPGMAVHQLAHPSLLKHRERVLRTVLGHPLPQAQRRIISFLFWTVLGQGRVGTAIELSSDPRIKDDRVTMLYAARAFGYPISERILERALTEARSGSDSRGALPTDASVSPPVIFERGAYAAERSDWTEHAKAKEELQALISMVEPESVRDTSRMRGLIRALEGYATWKRGEQEQGLVLLRNAQRQTVAGGEVRRTIAFERNLIIRAWLAELLAEMDRPREALIFYESLGPGSPFGQDPMIYFHLGRIRERVGDRDGAVEAYEVAAVAWRDPDPAIERLAETARREAARLAKAAVN